MTSYGDSPHGSDWSSASNVGRKEDRPQLEAYPKEKPALSRLNQQVLSEDEYTQAVSDIIKRTFFPQLRELDARNDLIQAYQSEDPQAIEDSVRRMRELVTPTPRRRARGATPGHTPFGTEPSDTPTYFSETPSSSRATPRHAATAGGSSLRYDPNLSLDAFQEAYTSEDNSSFAELLAKDNAERRAKYGWAWEAERKANLKAVRGREARERLVDVTRRMVEGDPEGVVRMIEGAPGRPGERRLVVEGKLAKEGAMGRLMVEGKTGADGRLMITDGGGDSVMTVVGKAAEEKEGAQFIDWDKPTAEEVQDNKEPEGDELQVQMEGWPFTNRNTFMFPPDADGRPIVPDPEVDGLPLGELKGIRYHATRLDHVEKAVPGAPSPSRSRIHAAISGTPYPGSSSRPSSTPKVAGFSFVDALPTPRASTIDPKDLQELMTWGSIESTPTALRSAASSARSVLGEGGGPFRIGDTSKREALAHKMANKAKRSLADRGGLRRDVLSSSFRGGGARRREEGTPRSPSRGGADLSPAAKSLLKKTGQGRALERGMATTPGWKEEDRVRVLRAQVRAREVESRDSLKRTTWDQSPASDLGAFEQDRRPGMGTLN